MKIVVSVNELATETQVVIDNMRRSKAPVMIGDADKPLAVLISLEEYERLQRQAQSAAASEPTQPVAATVAMPAAKSSNGEAVAGAKQAAPAAPRPPTPAEVIPAAQHSDIAQRAAAAIQANRPSQPAQVVSQRQTTLQPDPTLSTTARPAAAPATTRAPDGNNRAAAMRSPRLTKPLPKPPRPLDLPKPRLQLSLASIPGGWQTIALVVGMLALGIIGFALIVSAFGG
jgi:PHD/YefM family antitoxin component YafN of YafNO toxin-antitoxin module